MFLTAHTGHSQLNVSWTDSFTSGVGPTTAAAAKWDSFLARIDTSANYSYVRISGTFNDSGITCNEPAVVKYFAKALYTNSNFNATLCNGNNWGLCSKFNGEVWLNPPSTCAGSNCPIGYIIRPGHPPVGNWGGNNTATCGGPTQRMTLEFGFAPCPFLYSTAVTNASSSTSSNGSISIDLSFRNDIRYLRWATKEGINYPSSNDGDITGLAPGNYTLFLVSKVNEPCYLGPVTVGP